MSTQRDYSAGQTFTADSHAQTFEVTIHSLEGVTPDRVKAHLQKLWKVLHIRQISGTAKILGEPVPDFPGDRS
jgi:hypothetical protein